jgi:hypothetical protein
VVIVLKSNIRYGWVDRKVCEYACKKWHYSKCCPSGKLYALGFYEDDNFIGTIIFSGGANYNMGKRWNLKTDESGVLELTRVAFNNHNEQVSHFLSIAIKELKKRLPDLQLLISYADITQGHKGIIYRATNWLLLEKINGQDYYYVNGIKTHKKTIYGQMQNWNKNNKKQYSNQLQFAKDHISADAYIAKDKGKYKYAYPLNKKMRKRLLKECIPYD